MATARNVYLEMSGRVHNYFESFISNPPAGYHFYSKDQFARMGLSNRAVSSYEKWIKPIQASSRIPVKLAKSMTAIFDRPPPGTDLVMTNGFLDFRNEKWVTIAEHALASLMGVTYDMRVIHPIVQKSLASKNCKSVICFFRASLNSLFSTYDTSTFNEKLRLVPLGVPLIPRGRRGGDSRLKVVLLGSINYSDETVFYIRGGHIAIESFLRVAKEFDNMTLIMRTSVPAQYRAMCARHPNITILDKPLDEREYDRLLWEADICLVPFFDTPWMTFLDAMNHELPIVTTNLHANSEVVRNGEWGVVCKTPSALSTIVDNYNIPNRRVYREIRDTWLYNYGGIVENLALAVKTLVRDESLRREMGRKGRNQLEEAGEFSLRKRNRVLKEVLDEAFEW